MSNTEKTRANDAATATVKRGVGSTEGAVAKGVYHFEAYGPGVILATQDVEDVLDINGNPITAGYAAMVPKNSIDAMSKDGLDFEILTEPELKWSDDAQNIVTNEGLDHILDSTLAGGTQITSWFVGLTDDTPSPAAGDTLASHAGWDEFTEYTDDRKAWTAGSVSGQSVDNSGSPASFSINNDTNGGLGGAFLASVATGTSGTLYSAVALTGGNRVVNNGDTVEVTYTFTQADDGA